MAAILEENTLQMAVNEIILLAFLQDGRHMTSTTNQELCCIVMNINFLTFSLYYFLAVKAMLHGAIFLATCNAILLLRDVKLPNTSLHCTPLMFSQHIKNSSLISLINISQE
jgi:hypothetical protein